MQFNHMFPIMLVCYFFYKKESEWFVRSVFNFLQKQIRNMYHSIAKYRVFARTCLKLLESRPQSTLII